MKGLKYHVTRMLNKNYSGGENVSGDHFEGDTELPTWVWKTL